MLACYLTRDGFCLNRRFQFQGQLYFYEVASHNRRPGIGHTHARYFSQELARLELFIIVTFQSHPEDRAMNSFESCLGGFSTDPGGLSGLAKSLRPLVSP